jgi:hypothetical protein
VQLLPAVWPLTEAWEGKGRRGNSKEIREARDASIIALWKISSKAVSLPGY